MGEIEMRKWSLENIGCGPIVFLVDEGSSGSREVLIRLFSGTLRSRFSWWLG
jgi:hypothetical protein